MVTQYTSITFDAWLVPELLEGIILTHNFDDLFLGLLSKKELVSSPDAPELRILWITRLNILWL